LNIPLFLRFSTSKLPFSAPDFWKNDTKNVLRSQKNVVFNILIVRKIEGLGQKK
jgi:hypothetical protein